MHIQHRNREIEYRKESEANKAKAAEIEAQNKYMNTDEYKNQINALIEQNALNITEQKRIETLEQAKDLKIKRRAIHIQNEAVKKSMLPKYDQKEADLVALTHQVKDAEDRKANEDKEKEHIIRELKRYAIVHPDVYSAIVTSQDGNDILADPFVYSLDYMQTFYNSFKELANKKSSEGVVNFMSGDAQIPEINIPSAPTEDIEPMLT